MQAVAGAMDGLAAKLKAIAIVDSPNTDDESAIAYFNNFGSKRVFAVDPWLKVWDTETGAASTLLNPRMPQASLPDRS